ncbi:cingulin-like [Dermacentor albipictus]|uniref:cingulin-like n=1 Tax=Dermacentor albipictus TaxID=60249 RepID=UPI0031FDC8EC
MQTLQLSDRNLDCALKRDVITAVVVIAVASSTTFGAMNSSNSGADFDPVAAEIAIVRALDELCARRSNVALHRARIDELRQDIAHLHERIDAEKHRLRVTEQRMSERRTELGRDAERRRRPMAAEKEALAQCVARAESKLFAVTGRARSLETEKLTLEGKVKDLLDEARHLEDVLRERGGQLDDISRASRPVLEEFGKLVARQDAMQSSLLDALGRRVALERERRELAKQESRLASEGASLKKELELATSSSAGEVEDVGDGTEAGHVQSPAPDRWYTSFIEKLEGDAASCQRDLESLRRAINCSTSTDDVAVQTTPNVPDASFL